MTTAKWSVPEDARLEHPYTNFNRHTEHLSSVKICSAYSDQCQSAWISRHNGRVVQPERDPIIRCSLTIVTALLQISGYLEVKQSQAACAMFAVLRPTLASGVCLL